jgi:flagellar motility protein MotE (MotC chaperone)
MKLLSNPLIPLLLGLLLGVGTGVGIFWREARTLALAVRAHAIAEKEPVRPDKPWDFWTLEIENLASELKDTKDTLTAREQAITAREERLAADMRELDKTRQQIEALRLAVAADMVQFEGEESKNLKVLAKTYSELTPKAAVGILRQMDETVVVKILHLMKTDAVSPILQEMGTSADPDLAKKAAKLSERLRLVKALKTAS